MAGFSNGLIRLYDIDTGHKTVEIAAHGRSLASLDVAQDSGLVGRLYNCNLSFVSLIIQICTLSLPLSSLQLLSVSEDCTACVWKLPSGADEKVLGEYVITQWGHGGGRGIL